MTNTTGEDKSSTQWKYYTLRVQCEYCDAITTGEVVYDSYHNGDVIPVLVQVHHRCI